MPRKNNVIAVEPWPNLKVGELYPGRVKGARVDKASNRVHVTMENLEPVQANRIHELALPLPVHPGNKTALFFVTCGINATAGTTICLDQIINAIVGMRFRGLGVNDSEEFEFERISTPPTSGTDPSAGRTGKHTHLARRDAGPDESHSQ